MPGDARQLGLVPVSLAATMRTIELNDVAVPMNTLARSIGRMAAGGAAGLDALWNARRTVAVHAAWGQAIGVAPTRFAARARVPWRAETASMPRPTIRAVASPILRGAA